MVSNMAKDSSFDIVSDFDLAKLTNAIEQSQREMANRYDFKGTNAKLEFEDSNKTSLMIYGDNEFHLDSIEDILRKKLAGVGISPKVLDTTAEPMTANMVMRKQLKLVKGLTQEKAKKITSLIRTHYPKVKAQIQGEEIRVVSPKLDELQAVMKMLNDQDLDFPISFTNYR
jgi:uncharacterized protein YajQ (UPF0234 family)